MSRITKCYKVTVVLTYWEVSGEVSELSYKSLLFISSKRSYCSIYINNNINNLPGRNTPGCPLADQISPVT